MQRKLGVVHLVSLPLLLSAGATPASAAGLADVAGRWSSSDCARDVYDISVNGPTVIFRHNAQTYRETIQTATTDSFVTVAVGTAVKWRYQFLAPDQMRVTSSSSAKVTDYHRCAADQSPGATPPPAASAPAAADGLHRVRPNAAPPPTTVTAGATIEPTPATSPPPGGLASVAELLRHPRITPLVLALMYQKLSGDPPDFQTYAERSQAVQSASAFDRVDITHREIARLQALFNALNPDEVYTLQLGDSLNPYDTTRSLFPLTISDNHFVNFNDPGRNLTYRLQFDNIVDYNVIPMPNTAAAREFALRHQLGSSATGVTLDIAFRFAKDVPPPGQTAYPPVFAHILAIRITRPNNDLLAEFGPKQDQPSPEPASADVQGIRIGMTYDEADAIATKSYTTARRDGYQTDETYFNDYSNPRPWGECGKVRVGFDASDIAASYGGSNQRYSSCLGFRMDSAWTVGTTPRPIDNRVREVYSDQRLSGVAAADIKASLIKKYGRPTSIASSTNAARVNEQYAWTVPIESTGKFAQVNAWLQSDPHGVAGKDLDLSIQMQLYVDTRQRPAEPHVTGGPRL